MNISLIGMPASGKTTTAKALKNFLKDYIIVDTDDKIVEKENRSINEIFETDGEQYFRKLESNILREILQNDKQIISTGGGIIKNEENIKLLREKSVIIYLETDIDTLYERAKQNIERPLLNVENIKTRLEKLFKEREKNYQKAHYILNTKNKTPDIQAKEITEVLNENGRS